MDAKTSRLDVEATLRKLRRVFPDFVLYRALPVINQQRILERLCATLAPYHTGIDLAPVYR